MPTFNARAVRYEQTDGRTDPNLRKHIIFFVGDQRNVVLILYYIEINDVRA